MSVSEDPVVFEVADGVGTVVLNRPAAMNAFDQGVVDGLHAALDETVASPEIRCLLITGAPPAFCAGADLKMVARDVGKAEPSTQARMFVHQLHAAVLRLHELPVPTVCAVNGACAGGAVGLALACDITWAGASGSFTSAFSAIALTPDTGTSTLLPRAVGERVARELMFTSRRVRADEALTLGLVSRVCPDDELLSAATTLALGLARGATRALVATRKMLDEGHRRPFAEQLELEKASAFTCLSSRDMAEGVQAFIEKRKPVFRGD